MTEIVGAIAFVIVIVMLATGGAPVLIAAQWVVDHGEAKRLHAKARLLEAKTEAAREARLSTSASADRGTGDA